MILNCRITCHLGSGQFGTVEKGVWYSKKEPVVVAIKTLKGVATKEEEVKFLQEAAINGQFHHPNVIELYGVVTTGQPVSESSDKNLTLHNNLGWVGLGWINYTQYILLYSTIYLHSLIQYSFI